MAKFKLVHLEECANDMLLRYDAFEYSKRQGRNYSCSAILRCRRALSPLPFFRWEKRERGIFSVTFPLLVTSAKTSDQDQSAQRLRNAGNKSSFRCTMYYSSSTVLVRVSLLCCTVCAVVIRCCCLSYCTR